MDRSKSIVRWWDILSVLLMMCALLTSATRLYATRWTGFLERAQYLVILGAAAGLLLGQSRFSKGWVRFFALAYTLFAIPWQLGTTAGSAVPWQERLISLQARMATASYEFIHSQVVHDPILFLTLMTLLFWIIGLVSGYYLTRHGQPWPAILSSGITMIVIDHYDPGLSSWGRYVIIFVILSLLLIGRMTYLHYRHEWQSTGVMPAPGASLDLGRAAMFAVVALVAAAWLAPGLGGALPQVSRMWVEVTKPWQQLSHRFSDAFSSLQSSVGSVGDIYGDNLSLGTGANQGDGIVFTVRASIEPPPGARYYWKNRSYDTYTTNQWAAPSTQTQSENPNEPALPIPQWKGREEVTFTFESQVSLLNTLFTSPVPIWVSRPGDMAGVNTGNDTWDTMYINANPPLHAGETYQVRGMVSIPTITELQEAGVDYPEWVTQRDLQIPDGFPTERFKQLAESITTGMTNPYDKAAAITQWLRQNIQYSTNIPNPPAGIEPLEWFLFVYREGFCNYYASGEVMLLRSIGIPARLSVGYAEGQISKDAPIFTVRNHDSHAWPEVFFPGYGWVEFEPTVSQAQRVLLPGSGPQEGDPNFVDPSLRGRGDLPLGPLEDNPRDIGGFGGSQSAQRAATIRKIIIIGSPLALILMIGVAWRTARVRYQVPAFPIWLETRLSQNGRPVPKWLSGWARRAHATPMAKAYGLLNQALKILGKPPHPSDTPSERGSQLMGILPQAVNPVQTVVTEYQVSQYSPHIGDLGKIRSASDRVRRLAYEEVVRRLARRFWRGFLRHVGR